MWQKSDLSTVNSRGVLFLGKNGKFYKWRDTNSERGGEGSHRKSKFAVNPCCSQVALTLLSSCSFSGIEV